MNAYSLRKFRPKPQSGFLSIQAGSGGVAYSEVSWQAGRPHLAACALRSGDAALAKSWSLFSQAPLPVSLVLMPGEYQLLPIDAPPVPPEEMKMAVRWRIKDLIDFPIDDATVDVVRLDAGQPESANKLLAVVAHNQVVKRYIHLAEQARLTLTAIDIPELAQRNIASLLEVPDRVTALLSFTSQGGLLTLTRNGNLCFYRRLECMPGALNESDSERMQQTLDRLALELQRTFDHIERQYSHWGVDNIVLAPPPSDLEIMDYLNRQLYLPLKQADLSDVIDGVLPDPGALSDCWFALGGALRREDKAL